MRVLRNMESIRAEIDSAPDLNMRALMAQRVQYLSQYDDCDLGELINFLMIEPGDSLQEIDITMERKFLVNHFSGATFGDPHFEPSYETLEEYPTFYEMMFIQGDEGFGVSVLVPKGADIDPEVLKLCAKHATRATEYLP